jgi:hypothetical protein
LLKLAQWIYRAFKLPPSEVLAAELLKNLAEARERAVKIFHWRCSLKL